MWSASEGRGDGGAVLALLGQGSNDPAARCENAFTSFTKAGANARVHVTPGRAYAEVLVVIVARRREHEPRRGGADPRRAQRPGSNFADARHDRRCGHDMDGEARSLVLTRCQVRSAGVTTYEKANKRAYNGDVAEFSETEDASKHMEKLDDRWLALVLWLGKSDRGEEHLVAPPRGKALATGGTVRRWLVKSRWTAEAVRELQVTPWETKVEDVKLLEPRRRYITNQMVNCRELGESTDKRASRTSG